jgi:hypothetical protein
MSDSQSTHAMISALTSYPSQGEGIGEDELMVLEVVQLVHLPLTALNCVFDCHNLELCIVGGKTDGNVVGVTKHSVLCMLQGL